MPPRLTYWTGIWEPAREALSREVVALRDIGRTRAVVSFSRGQRSALSLRSRVIRLSGARWAALRALAQIVERAGDVTHVFGALDDWHYVRCLGRRPLVFTVAIEGSGALLPDRGLYDRVRMFVAESEVIRDALVAGGIPPARIRLVHPGVDLETFAPRPAPDGRFRLLFASTPSDPAEFDARGIPLLVELARALPAIDVVCAWRQWGDTSATDRALAALEPPPNFLIEAGDFHDMAARYAGAHAVACFFAPRAGKSAPNSVIEGLACGRPAIVSHSCGISRLVARRGAGIAVPRRLPEIVESVRALQGEYAAYAGRARALAEAAFDIDRFRRAYAGLYDTLSQQQN